MLSSFIIDNDFITAWMVLQQLGNQGIGYDSDMGIRIGFPDSHQGRNGHNGIAEPVGRADHDALNFIGVEFFQET